MDSVTEDGLGSVCTHLSTFLVNSMLPCCMFPSIVSINNNNGNKIVLIVSVLLASVRSFVMYSLQNIIIIIISNITYSVFLHDWLPYTLLYN